MDDIYGILFYILLLVLGGLASAYRNKNKKKTSGNPRPGPKFGPVFEEMPGPLTDPFEEFVKRFRADDQPAEVVTEKEEEIMNDGNVVSLETIINKPEEEGTPVFEETMEAMMSDEEEMDNPITQSQISDSIRFDDVEHHGYPNLKSNIKQAIIYSEILKRKQF